MVTTFLLSWCVCVCVCVQVGESAPNGQPLSFRVRPTVPRRACVCFVEAEVVLPLLHLLLLWLLWWMLPLLLLLLLLLPLLLPLLLLLLMLPLPSGLSHFSPFLFVALPPDFPFATYTWFVFASTPGLGFV